VRNKHVVVIGASAGGIEALQKVLSALPADFGAPVFVVVHLQADAESFLPQILSRSGRLRASHPVPGERIEAGRIYAAPPDRHVLVFNSTARVVRGPKENRHRPSIDVLFRSAALECGEKVIGVLLTGSDDDGAAGLKAVQDRGGITIVQDPEDSQYPQMPASALRVMQPDFTLPLAEIGPRLNDLVGGAVKRNGRRAVSKPIDKSFGQEEGKPIDVSLLGTPTAFTCPDCSGTLWELRDGELVRYRCRLGHAFSTQSMLEAESDQVERSLWEAVRTLEESAGLCRRIARITDLLRDKLLRQGEEREGHARVIRDLLLSSTGKWQPGIAAERRRPSPPELERTLRAAEKKRRKGTD
jgi:two-component system chemotaxis response regulator CheB